MLVWRGTTVKVVVRAPDLEVADVLVGPEPSFPPASMRWEKECPLRAQSPISASVVGRYDIVVGGDIGIDRLVTDLEDAHAAADRQRPAIIVISLPVGGDEGARGQVLALGEVIIEE